MLMMRIVSRISYHSRLCKAFANNSLANIKLLKSRVQKIGKSGELLVRLLGPLSNIALLLIGNVF